MAFTAPADFCTARGGGADYPRCIGRLRGVVASVGSSSSFRWPRHLPTQFGNAGRNSIGHPRRGAVVSSARAALAG